MKENQIMRDIATATLSGNLTARSSCGRGPRVPMWRGSAWASGTRRRNGEEWAERTNYFTVEVYGPQAHLRAERLGKGSRVVADAELDWREWTDQGQNRRETVVLRARQILFERTGLNPPAEREPGDRDASSDGEPGAAAGAASPAGADDVPF
jgi:single-stranded DNA-binding protein